MNTTVAIIYGGRSGEHEISIRSAKSIREALDRTRYDVVDYFIDPTGKWSPEPILPEPGAQPEIDVVFPVLHGTFGEDGTVQGLLELADLPYVGAGVMASAVSMDKEMMKRICIERALPVVEYVALGRHDLDAEAIAKLFSFPVFVKPANLGSSVGISKVHNLSELEPALQLAAEFDRKIIVERAILGRELECAVLGNDDPKASLPCEILPSKEFYDYEDKYLLDRAQTKLPAELAPDQTAETPAPGRRMLSRGGLRRHGARRFPAGVGYRQALPERDQYHPRLHLDQHVSQDVGAERHFLFGAARPPDRTRARAPRGQESHPFHPLALPYH